MKKRAHTHTHIYGLSDLTPQCGICASVDLTGFPLQLLNLVTKLGSDTTSYFHCMPADVRDLFLPYLLSTVIVRATPVGG